MDNSKSDVEAKKAFVKELKRDNFENVKIISSPTDISAFKGKNKFFFELKFTNQKNKYFGAATLTEWECAIHNLNNFFFVIARLHENKWIFDKFSPEEFIQYSTIPPFKIFFNVDLKNFNKKRPEKTRALNASFENMKELATFYKKLKNDKKPD